MNINELVHILEKNQVPRRYYSFDGAGGGDCFALEFIDSHWVISYYSERGTRREEGVFTSEDEACRAMFDRMKMTVQEESGRTIFIGV